MSGQFRPYMQINNMRAYVYELIVGKRGTLTLKNLPFNAGEKVEVIIIPRSSRQLSEKQYPFWGKPITYIDPTDPAAESDWEVMQ